MDFFTTLHADLSASIRGLLLEFVTVLCIVPRLWTLSGRRNLCGVLLVQCVLFSYGFGGLKYGFEIT